MALNQITLQSHTFSYDYYIFFHQIQVTLAKKEGGGYYCFVAVASWESGELNCIYYKQFDIFEKVLR